MDATTPALPVVPSQGSAGPGPGETGPLVIGLPDTTGVPQVSTRQADQPPAAHGQGDWAICCSGGGIRSATYCLGALQRLDQDGVLGKARWILGVSGGSYIAASRALVAHDLATAGAGQPGDDHHAYARGTPEEQSLRDNTHYVAPDAKTMFVAVLSLLIGAAATLLLAIAPVYALAHAWGWLLRWQGVLTPSGAKMSASVTAWTWWLAPAVMGAVTLVLFAFWWLTLPSGGTARGARRARWVGWAAAIAAALALAMLGAPLLISWLYDHHTTGALGTVLRFFGFGGSGVWSWATVPAVVAATVTLARASQNHLAKISIPSSPGDGSSGVVSKLGLWARGKLMPWFASALVVAVAAFAALLWIASAARAGFGLSQLVPVLVALGVMFLTRLAADVNRTSLHDFYRWRLADAYAITRRALRKHDTPAGEQLLAAAAQTRLSAFAGDARSGDKAEPELVIGATANINVNREVPPGRGGFSFTFDPRHVILRGAPGHADEEIRARTVDYEHLVGHNRLTLFDVVAISGAAFSPLMGAMTRGAYRILLTATNLRLGVWLPHPHVVRAARELLDSEPDLGKEDRWWWHLLLWYMLPHPLWHRNPEKSHSTEARLWAHVLRLREHDTKENGSGWQRRLAAALWWRAMQPTLGMLWAEAVGHTSYRATWVNVTDGGHYDNLGLVEALQRQATNIIVLDASGDRPDTWYTLGGAMALARSDAGVEIDLDPTSMIGANGSGPAPSLRRGQVVQPWAHGTFTRLNAVAGAAGGPPPTGQIWVCKLGWWEQAPWDIRAFAVAHDTYPCEPTFQQLYDGAEFEAYHALGTYTIKGAAEAATHPLVINPPR